MSAFSKCTLAYLRHFFFARFNIFSEKSVATRLLHRCAVSFVSNPVPQAHSKTSYSGRIRFFTTEQSSSFVFRLITFAKTSYTHATLSQNIAYLRYFSLLISLLPLKIRFLHFPPYHQTHHRHRTVPTDHELSF